MCIRDSTSGLCRNKLLKLLYLMEEHMALKYHVPFIGMPYELWHAGPVSYTHLFKDAFQRSVLNYLYKQDLLIKFTLGINRNKLVKYVPVSYTHLDVYKRQLPNPYMKYSSSLDVCFNFSILARSSASLEDISKMCIRDRNKALHASF